MKEEFDEVEAEEEEEEEEEEDAEDISANAPAHFLMGVATLTTPLFITATPTSTTTMRK